MIMVRAAGGGVGMATKDEDVEGLLASSSRCRRIMLDRYFDGSEARAECNEEEAKCDRCARRNVTTGIRGIVISNEIDINRVDISRDIKQDISGDVK